MNTKIIPSAYEQGLALRLSASSYLIFEELQSKSVIRNLLMKRKYNTSPNKKQHTE